MIRNTTGMILLMLISLISCDDFLDIEPKEVVTEVNVFEDEVTAREAVNAMYDPLGYGERALDLGISGHSYEFIVGDICSDDAIKGSFEADQIGIARMREFNADPGTLNLTILWSKHYIAIFRANMVLRNLANSPLSSELKNEFEAEARFIRAYSYFVLVRVYGRVPLFTEPVAPDEISDKNFRSSPIYETYQLIDEDLSFAMQNLKLKGEREVGRANRGAAAAYAARAIMYQIGTDNTNNRTWQDVLDITNDFIAGNYGSYSLVPNYATIFDTEGENNNESIFEIQSVDTGVDPFSEGIFVGSEWTVFQMPQRLGGWGFNTPTQDLVDAYEVNDPRRQNTAIAVGEHVYGIPMENTERNQTGYFPRKAILDPDEWITEKGSGYNIRKFRYADILLMNAEAAYHTGNAGQAINRLTEIRNRASQSTFPRGFDPNAPYDYSSTGFAPLNNTLIPAGGQQLLDFIHLERRREFGMEQLRFWDMVRTGKYIANMSGKFGVNATDIETRSFMAGGPETEPNQNIINPIPVFPIPALEVSDWGIKQNPGY